MFGVYGVGIIIGFYIVFGGDIVLLIKLWGNIMMWIMWFIWFFEELGVDYELNVFGFCMGEI